MFEVPATSAFVLLFTEPDIYYGDSAKKLLASVDLSTGLGIKNHFEEYWEDIYEEVANRKTGVQIQCRAYLNAQPEAQIVCLGGGLDPLSLDLAEAFSLAAVFDVDIANMDLKQEINHAIGGPEVTFCTADLTNPTSLISTLESKGWNPEHPTLIVAEGITYYVPKPLFRAALAAFRTSGGALVLEYSLPDDVLTGTPRAEDYEDFFQRLYQLLEMPFPPVRYDDSYVNELAEALSGRLVQTQRQHELEFLRKGKNVLRPDPAQGAIQVSTIRFD